jgi:hypothetical protein
VITIAQLYVEICAKRNMGHYVASGAAGVKVLRKGNEFDLLGLEGFGRADPI